VNRTDVSEQVDAQLAEHDDVVRLSSQQIALLEQAQEAVGQLAPVPYRWVRGYDEKPPEGRIRMVGRHIIERWKPTMKRYDEGERVPPVPAILGYEVWQARIEVNDDLCDCIGSIKIEGGMHPECGRKRVNLAAYWNAEESRPQSFGDHVRDLHISAMSDDDFNMFYPTLPGNDIAHYDRAKEGTADAFRGGDILYGQPDAKGVRHPVRGGREIRHGRREHREATKNMHYLSSGWAAHLDRIKAEKKAEQDKRRRQLSEKIAARWPDHFGEV
jgi:hypothetical protein